MVPSIKQVLFDPLSRVALTPGTEVRRTVADDGWLAQKHRELVQDYSDVSATEKEYIREWESFLLGRRMSSEAYLPRAAVAFVKEKASWLVADETRMHEFGKHLAVLEATWSLGGKILEEVLGLIAEARAAQGKKPPPPPLPPPPKPTVSPRTAAYRSKGGCAVCKLPVLGITQLLCANKVSPSPVRGSRAGDAPTPVTARTRQGARLTVTRQDCVQRAHHDDCVEDKLKDRVDSDAWYCKKCRQPHEPGER